MQQELEDLRKHEDDLIFSEANIFLIAQTLLVTAISIGASANSIVKFIITSMAILLSILWIILGFRHNSLMKWHNDEISKLNIQDRTHLTQIHIKLRDWKKQNCSYYLTGHNHGFSATYIRCILIPFLFLGFWIFMFFFQIIQLIIHLRFIYLQVI